MKTSIRLIGATLGATAVVGSSAVAANAHGFGGQHGPEGLTAAEGGHHHRGHRAASFAQRKAAILSRLTAADDRLTRLSDKLATAATSDPDGDAAQELARVQQHQAKLEALISAVEAASTEQELEDAFKAAFDSSTPPSATPDPSQTPAPSDSSTPAPSDSATSAPSDSATSEPSDSSTPSSTDAPTVVPSS